MVYLDSSFINVYIARACKKIPASRCSRCFWDEDPCTNLTLVSEERDMIEGGLVDETIFLCSCDSRDDYCDSTDKAE